MPAISWKSLDASRSRAERQEPLLLERPQQHGLLVEPELADLVEEQHAAVGAAQQAGPIAQRAGERAAHVAEQRRHRGVAADGGAVHLDERPAHEAARLLQVVDAPRQRDLPAPVGPSSSMGAARARGDAIERVDQPR